MEVKLGERKFRVFWMYNCYAIPFMAKEYMNANKEVVEKLAQLPMKKQREEFSKLYPDVELPKNIETDVTWCYIVEGEKIIITSSVSRYHKDREDRDKARKFSLAKALRGSEFDKKEIRIQFWEAYLNRAKQTQKKTVDKPTMVVV